MTPSVTTPLQILTIRAHLVNKTTIIATYAFGTGNNFQTGHKIYWDTSGKALKRAKLEILNQALMELGEDKSVSIETDDKFILGFLENGTFRNEAFYQDIVDHLRINLSLCSSVTHKSWITSSLFNAALQEYKSVKKELFPDTSPSYLEIFAAQKRMREARQYGAAYPAGSY